MVSMKKLSGVSRSEGRFGGVVEVGELPEAVFRALSTELVRDNGLFSVEEVLVK